MNPSTAEWKARIEEHEAKLTQEIGSHQIACQKQEFKFLETINKSYQTELSGLVSNLESGHKKSREATLLVLGQLYTDFDQLKKETFTKITDLEKKLSTSQFDGRSKADTIDDLDRQLKITRQELAKTKALLETSMAEHSEEIRTRKKVEGKLARTEDLLEAEKDAHSAEVKNSNELKRRLNNTTDLLEKSRAEHTEESKTRRKLEAKLAKTEDFLEISMTKHSEETQKSKGLEAKLEKTEKELSDTKVNLRMMTMDKNELDTISGHLEVKLKEVKSKLVKSQGELEDANEIIVHLKENQKMRVGPTVNFFKGVSIKNFPPFICDGTQKSIVYLNVSEPIELESMGFLGPLDVDALYEVTLQVNRMAPRGNKWKIIGQAKKKVQARRQQVFHVDFDEPITLEDFATSEKNSFSNSHGFYNINYTLKGPNTQSADILDGDNNVEMADEMDGIVFYTKWYHNHWAEIGYRKC